jgi:hypothetical protein
VLVEGNASFVEYGIGGSWGWWKPPDELHEVEHCGYILLVHNVQQVIDLAC